MVEYTHTFSKQVAGCFIPCSFAIRDNPRETMTQMTREDDDDSFQILQDLEAIIKAKEDRKEYEQQLDRLVEIVQQAKSNLSSPQEREKCLLLLHAHLARVNAETKTLIMNEPEKDAANKKCLKATEKTTEEPSTLGDKEKLKEQPPLSRSTSNPVMKRTLSFLSVISSKTTPGKKEVRRPARKPSASLDTVNETEEAKSSTCPTEIGTVATAPRSSKHSFVRSSTDPVPTPTQGKSFLTRSSTDPKKATARSSTNTTKMEPLRLPQYKKTEQPAPKKNPDPATKTESEGETLASNLRPSSVVRVTSNKANKPAVTTKAFEPVPKTGLKGETIVAHHLIPPDVRATANSVMAASLYYPFNTFPAPTMQENVSTEDVSPPSKLSTNDDAHTKASDKSKTELLRSCSSSTSNSSKPFLLRPLSILRKSPTTTKSHASASHHDLHSVSFHSDVRIHPQHPIQSHLHSILAKNKDSQNDRNNMRASHRTPLEKSESAPAEYMRVVALE